MSWWTAPFLSKMHVGQVKKGWEAGSRHKEPHALEIYSTVLQSTNRWNQWQKFGTVGGLRITRYDMTELRKNT